MSISQDLLLCLPKSTAQANIRVFQFFFWKDRGHISGYGAAIDFFLQRSEPSARTRVSVCVCIVLGLSEVCFIVFKPAVQLFTGIIVLLTTSVFLSVCL